MVYNFFRNILGLFRRITGNQLICQRDMFRAYYLQPNDHAQDIDAYGPTGRHLGAMDPQTNQPYKPRTPGRFLLLQPSNAVTSSPLPVPDKPCCYEFGTLLQRPDAPVFYCPVRRLLHLKISDMLCQQLGYCPWCGSDQLPALTDEYIAAIEVNCKIDPRNISDTELPEILLSDEWWKTLEARGTLE